MADPTSPPEDVYDAAARRITHDRMGYYGYTAEHIAAAEAEDHSNCDRQGDAGLLCFDEDGHTLHQAYDDLNEAAEFVMWVLEHPAIAELRAAGVAAGRAQAAADIRSATWIDLDDVREWAASTAEGGEPRG